MTDQCQRTLEHPFSPEAHWKFAISRRFNIPRVERLLNDIVLPTLLDRVGIVLECSHASDEIQSENFWMNRMKVILEIADVHIFFAIDISPQVEFEEQYSRDVVCKGRTPSVDTNFHLSGKKRRALAPGVIIIREGRSLFDKYHLNPGPAIVHCGHSPYLDNFRQRFEHALDSAIKIRKCKILKANKYDEAGGRLIKWSGSKMLDWTMKILERKAKTDPELLVQFGGNVENVRARIEKQLEREAISRRRRTGPDVKKTLIQETGLARRIAENSEALFTAGDLMPNDRNMVQLENETEAYLHKIRRGETEYTQSFHDVYKREYEIVHIQTANAINTIQKANPGLDLKELMGDKWFAHREMLTGFLNALRYRKRVRHAKKHVNETVAGGAGPHE